MRNVTDYPILGDRIGLEASYASGIVQLPDIGTRRLASIHGNPIIAPSRSEPSPDRERVGLESDIAGSARESEDVVVRMVRFD